MVSMLDENFGPCSLYGECAVSCPAGISLAAIATVNKERWRSVLRGRHSREN